jgi:protein O-GlcNAc transferase
MTSPQINALQIKAMCDQAVALHRAGRLAEAERLYVTVRMADPRNYTANYLMGVIQHGRGEAEDALASMEAALAANPNSPAPLIYRGLLLEAFGRTNEAIDCYNRVIQVQPSMVEALVNRGSLLARMGRHNHALADFESALTLKPDFVPALFNRGAALEQLERPEEALGSYDRTLALQPGHIEAMGNRGGTLRALKRPAEALAAFERLLEAQPNNAMAHYNRGVTLMDLSRVGEALSAFDRALGIDSGLAVAHGNRATALNALGRGEEALAAYDRAPQDFTTLSEKGALLHDLHRFAEALAIYDAALAIKPDAIIMRNRGGVLQNMGRMEEARAAYDAALTLNPGLVEALSNRAQLVWQHFKDHDAAITDLENLVKIDPYRDFAVSHLLHLRMLGADWHDYDTLLKQTEDGVRAGKLAARPFVFQAMSSSPADLQTCSQTYTAHRHPPKPAIWRRHTHDRIRLGYVCGEFREQATAFLTAGLFERHDRSRFEVFAFDNGYSDQSAMRARLEAGFEHFVPIAGLNDQSAAEEISRHDMDILVSLNGYFGQARMGVFARRPAPIQVNYLGFPATLGASYIDYIVADRIVIPEEQKRFYDEKVVWLPDTYQVNDDRRAIGPATTRAAHNLPEDAFVFCNFNHSYKLTPQMFNSWIRVMDAVPGSVLWLWDSNPHFADNLSREAEKRGVAASRLIFAPTAAHILHLARLGLADLALDSLPYNCHTTGSDALWAGVPLITCRGSTFPGRVAASLLMAAGLPELIVENLGDFEARAIQLSNDRNELARLRARLKDNRATLPLFNTERYRRNLEVAYGEMWERFQSGEAPASFSV